MAFGTYYLTVGRSWRSFRDAVAFGFAALGALGTYVLVFGGMSSIDAVLQPTFATATSIATDPSP